MVGARPQFIKAAMVSRALRRQQHEEVLIHTGQHYDKNLSRVFFDVLDIPEPDVNLGVGSASHGVQTGRMLEALEPVLQEAAPSVVLVYGDTNSTLAGGLGAAKLPLPLAHVEAGVRSYNRSMPEEVNRVLVDRIATHLLCPTETAVENLRAEGVTDGVYMVGDVMYDAALRYEEAARSRRASRAFGLDPGEYRLMTVHRPANADDRQRLGRILESVAADGRPTLFPAHPRTRRQLEGAGAAGRPGDDLRIVDPVHYLDFLSLLMDAEKVITDSGGVQKEAYIFEVPCVTLRGETEWEETLEGGWNVLVDADPEAIRDALAARPEGPVRPEVFGDGRAAEAVVRVLAEDLG